ncbi:MAG: hypothetical protein LLG01_04430 [Planctomycetaceae bacterium]|nr:hypothetical protein [Planctomycetaceae bacterium]
MTAHQGRSLEHILFEGKLSLGRPSLRAPGGNTLPAPPAENEPLDAFVAWVLEQAALPASAYRAAPLHRRLPACLRAIKADSAAHARRRIERDPQLLTAAVNSLLIGVTEFFRDAGVLEAVRDFIVAELAPRPGPVRIWSAACSNGAELYSMAILLAEAGLLDRCVLLGTDCRRDAICQSREGLYDPSSLKGMSLELRRKYLRQDGLRWRVVESLRRNIQWRIRDVLAGVEDGPWDVILWRNAAIYLKAQSAAAVWQEMVTELRAGGVLVSGRAERPPSPAGLRSINRCLYRLPREARQETKP